MRARAGAVLLLSLLAGANAARAETPSLTPLLRDVTVVAFFSRSCKPCKQELPLVEALRAHYADDAHVAVVAVSVDGKGEAAAARKLAAAAGLRTTPVLTDGEALYVRIFGGDELDLPRLAVIDRRGGGLERQGALAGETAERFVREVGGVVASVRAHSPRAPTMMWKLLFARP